MTSTRGCKEVSSSAYECAGKDKPKEVAIQCLVWPDIEPEVVDSIFYNLPLRKSIDCGIIPRTDTASA